MTYNITGKIYTDLSEPYGDINFLQRSTGWIMNEHQHPFFQMILITEGTLIIDQNQKEHEIHKGHLVIIPPFSPHKLSAPRGYQQFGINLRPTPDQRGLISLLYNHVSKMAIINRTDLLDLIHELIKGQEEFGLLSKLKIANTLDMIILSSIDMTMNQNWNFRNRLMGILNKNISKKLTLIDVAQSMALSITQLERLSNKEFGCGVICLFNQLKINTACTLLMDERRSIGDISEDLGFYDQAYFSKYFKKKTGMTPGKYRKIKLRSLY